MYYLLPTTNFIPFFVLFSPFYSILLLANALTKLFPVLVEFKKVHVASFPPAVAVPAITAAAAAATKGKGKGKSVNDEISQQQGLLKGSINQMEEV